MIIWLEKRLVLAVHDRQIAEHGGSAGLRDETLLESALARPQQLHAYGEPPPDLAGLAASLAYGLARNHPFVDGNKRTAYVACRVFLKLNGLNVTASLGDRHAMFVALGQGAISETDLAAWLRANLTALVQGKVQEQRAGYSPTD